MTITRLLASTAFLCWLSMPSQAATPCAEGPNELGSWSYRIIDGRRCWFHGRKQLPKESLFWPEEKKSKPAPGQIDTERAAPSLPKAEILFPTLQRTDNGLEIYVPLVWKQPWLTSASITYWPLLIDIDRTPFVAWDRRVGQ